MIQGSPTSSPKPSSSTARKARGGPRNSDPGPAVVRRGKGKEEVLLTRKNVAALVNQVDVPVLVTRMREEMDAGRIVDADVFAELVTGALRNNAQKLSLGFSTCDDAIYHLFEGGRKGASGTMYIGKGIETRCRQADSEAKQAVAGNVLETLRAHFSAGKEMGCRSLIDQYLAGAVRLAQQAITSDERLRQVLATRTGLPEDKLWIAVLYEADLSVPDAGEGWGLNGYVDFVMGLIDEEKKGDLRDGASMLHMVTTTLVEAKTSTTFEGAFCQVLAECVALLVKTGMPSCIGILSNGVRWKFFHVERIGPKFKASSTRNLHEADEGLIVELVKNAILLPAPEFVQHALS